MSVLNIVFAFILYLHSKKSISEGLFAFLTLNVGIWSLAIFLINYPNIDLSYLKFGILLHYFAGNLIFLSFFWFVLFYQREEVAVHLIWPILLSIGDFTLLFFMVFSKFIFVDIVKAATLSESMVFNKAGYLFYSVFLFSLFMAAELIMWRRFKNSTDLLRKHLKYIILGTSVAGLLGQTTNLILPAFGIFFGFAIGPVLSTIFIGIIGYAVLRHGLFNLKIIATEIFTLILVITISAQLLTSQSQFEIVSRGFVLLVAVVFGYFLIRSVYQEVRSKEKIENLANSLEAANVELKRLDQAKSEFISIASHQLRTPLTIIKGYLSMIREGSFGKVSTDISSTVNKVYLSNERLIKLVNDLLDLSRMESGKMKYEFAETNLEEIIESTVDEFQLPAKDKNIKITWKEGGNDMPKIWGDAWKLRQVIFNLIDNALKYSHDDDIEIKLEKEDDSLKLSVRDSGIGMTKETIGNIFQKFSRGRESTVAKVNAVGVGLGLYIAKRIVDDHGGKIWVESPGEGKGSVFYVRLPLVSAVKRNSQMNEFIEKI